MSKDGAESSEGELTEPGRRNKELEEKTGAIVETEYGERYRGLVISNSGDATRRYQLECWTTHAHP